MTDDVLLQADALSFRYGNERGVHAIDLRLQRGDVLGLLGLNGAGKSTTLRLLAGCLQPHAGSVRIAGQVLRPGAARGRARLGFLPEVAPLYRELTVDEQLVFSARLFGLGAKAARRAAARARERCGLDSVARRRVQALSQGMRRRLGIAQAIVHEPSVLLLDEPTTALDPAQIIQVRTLIRELGRSSAIILSSHLLHEVEAVCSRVAVLHEGRLVHAQSLPDHTAESQLLLTLTHDPGIEALRDAAHPAAANALGNGRYLLESASAHSLAPHIAEIAVSRHWGLQELAPRGETLERKFISLTCGEPAQP